MNVVGFGSWVVGRGSWVTYFLRNAEHTTQNLDRLGYLTRGTPSVGFTAHNSYGAEAPQPYALGKESQGDLKGVLENHSCKISLCL